MPSLVPLLPPPAIARAAAAIAILPDVGEGVAGRGCTTPGLGESIKRGRLEPGLTNSCVLLLS